MLRLRKASPLSGGLLLLLGLALAGAQGASIEFAPTLVTSGDPNDLRYQTPRGSGYDGVAGLLIESELGSFGCTGVLLDGRQSLLTAAHCLTGESGTLLPHLLVTAMLSWGAGTEVLSAAGFRIHPGWSGDVRHGNDLAIVRVAGPVAPAVQTYGLFTGHAEVQADFELAGFGASGTGATGRTIPPGERRRGQNTFDATMSGTVDIFAGWTAGEYVLMSDFDNGAAANDGFGVFFGRHDLGLGLDEVTTALGDSGSPAFLDGRVAGIASFGARLSFADGSGSDVDDILNSSFGEFSGFTRVSRFAPWIQAEAAVPEPSPAPLVAGLLLALYLGKRFGASYRGRAEPRP